MANNVNREVPATVGHPTGAGGQSQNEITLEELARFAETFADLACPAVMSHAWDRSVV